MSARPQSQHPKASFIIPAYNEEKRLPPTIKKIQAFLDQINIPAEVIIVVEKSSDQTVEAAKLLVDTDPRFIIQANPVRKGKGYAVHCGMMRARGEIVFFMDADLSTPLNEVRNFLDYFQAHPQCDILIGSRGLPESRVVRSQSSTRKSMGQSFNKIVQAMGLTGFRDTQCGFKAFRSSVVHEIFSRQTIFGFAFDVEILFIAQKLGYSVHDQAVEWCNDEDSKVHIVRDSMKMLKDLFVVNWTHRNLKPLARPESQKSAASA